MEIELVNIEIDNYKNIFLDILNGIFFPLYYAMDRKARFRSSDFARALYDLILSESYPAEGNE